MTVRMLLLSMMVLSLSKGMTAAEGQNTGLIAPFSRLEKIADGFIFSEGPASDRDGTIYFSDFQFYNDQDGLADFVDGRPLTRLLAYDPPSGTTRVVLDGLYAANGVALGPGDQYVLVNEFFAYRVTRFWLTGPKKGQVEPFIENLPGMPDNITFNGHDIFWVALYTRRSPLYDTLQSNPFYRGVIRRLPLFLLPTEPAKYGFVLGLDLDGNVIHNLQDPSGKFVSQVTSVFELDRMLYLGNIGDDTIHRIPRPT